MFNFDFPILVASIPAILIAMCIHEFAHAWTAVQLGDNTPRLMGRLTLNPLAHVDILGLVMLFLIRFGWAKPVTINPNNFSNPRRDNLLVSLAGPGSNLLTAFLFYFIFLLLGQFNVITPSSSLVLQLIIIYNINFAILNMLPLPPLDGFRIIETFIPYEWTETLYRLAPYSMLILVVLLYTPFFRSFFILTQRAIYGLFAAILSIFF